MTPTNESIGRAIETLRMVVDGRISGRISEWPQLKEACAVAARELDRQAPEEEDSTDYRCECGKLNYQPLSCANCGEAAPQPPAQEQGGIAWLIEETTGGTRWYCGTGDESQTFGEDGGSWEEMLCRIWTKDSTNAIRFARKVDAEKVMHSLGFNDQKHFAATEHVWLDAVEARPSLTKTVGAEVMAGSEIDWACAIMDRMPDFQHLLELRQYNDVDAPMDVTVGTDLIDAVMFEVRDTICRIRAGNAITALTRAAGAEDARDKADAARYRWMRNGLQERETMSDEVVNMFDAALDCNDPTQFDKAIDAAIASQAQEGEGNG